MWNNKLKAITFSFDDGCQQDIRLISLMNKYGIKGTFNLNSGLAGLNISFPLNGKFINRDICKLEEIKERYAGHEVAVHTLHHPDLTKISDDEVIKEINEDQKELEQLVGYKIVGMAYPGGAYNEHLTKLIEQYTSIKYARPATAPALRPGFNIPSNLLAWHQYYWLDDLDFDKLIDDFAKVESDKPQVLAIWGHSYEIDAFDGLFEKWEKLFKKISKLDNVFIGTNREILGL